MPTVSPEVPSNSEAFPIYTEVKTFGYIYPLARSPAQSYTCVFFAESTLPGRHQRDVISRAVWKLGTWVTAGR